MNDTTIQPQMVNQVIPMAVEERFIWVNNLPYFRALLGFIASMHAPTEWQYHNKAGVYKFFFDKYKRYSNGMYAQQPLTKEFEKISYAFWCDKMDYLNFLMEEAGDYHPVIELLAAIEGVVVNMKFNAMQEVNTAVGEEKVNG